MAHYDDLKTRAQEIRNEVKTGANTASRVGTALEGIVDALEAQAEVDEGMHNAIQTLQDDTEDLSSIRDSIDSHAEQIDNLVQEKQNTLNYYSEDETTSNIVAPEQVYIGASLVADSAGIHMDSASNEVTIQTNDGQSCMHMQNGDMTIATDGTLDLSQSTVKIDDSITDLATYLVNSTLVDLGDVASSSDAENMMRHQDTLEHRTQLFMYKETSGSNAGRTGLCLSIRRANGYGWRQYLYLGNNITFRYLSDSVDSNTGLYILGDTRHTTSMWLNLSVDNLTSDWGDAFLSANQGKVLKGLVDNLGERIYDLGNFSSSLDAENKAKEPAISGNNEIVVMRYTVNTLNKSGLLIQQVGDIKTVQYQIWDAKMYTRHIYFTDTNRTTIDSWYSNAWWAIGATNTKYDETTHRVSLSNFGGDALNPNADATIPLATTSTDGLMSKEQVAQLDGKQDQLTNYEESETSSGITVGSATLGVQEDAVLSGVTNDDEEIIANIITANEELATTSRGSAYGIVTTKDAISMRTSKGEISDVVEEVNNKADKVGYYPDLKVSFAEELVGRGDATERVISDITPTGEISIGDGNATIERVKGKSVVWNQCIDAKFTSITKDGLTITNNSDGTITVNGTNTNSSSITVVIQNIRSYPTNHKMLLIGSNKMRGWNDFTIYDDRIGANTAVKATGYNIYTSSDMLVICLSVWSDKSIDNVTFRPLLYDLTLMFGSGNEPTTIEEFEARKPLNVTNDYNEGEIISYDGEELKSVGFNAWDGAKAKVIGGQAYYLGGTFTSIGFTDVLDGELTTIEVPSDKIYTPSEDGYIYASGTDICINLSHSGYRNGDYEPYVDDVHPLPNISAINDADGNQLFPYGLLSAGSVYDEITATKAIKRVGVVDMGTLRWSYSKSANWPHDLHYAEITAAPSKRNYGSILVRYTIHNDVGTLEDKKYVTGSNNRYLYIYDSSYTSAADFKQAMQGVLLYYELAEPIEVDLPEPPNMTYEAWDFGTEELIASKPTTPLNADIVYNFNAVDRIRENNTKNTELEARIAALEAMITQLTQTTNEGEIDNEQM